MNISELGTCPFCGTPFKVGQGVKIIQSAQIEREDFNEFTQAEADYTLCHTICFTASILLMCQRRRKNGEKR
jgi:hypothetical protein